MLTTRSFFPFLYYIYYISFLHVDEITFMIFCYIFPPSLSRNWLIAGVFSTTFYTTLWFNEDFLELELLFRRLTLKEAASKEQLSISSHYIKKDICDRSCKATKNNSDGRSMVRCIYFSFLKMLLTKVSDTP